MKTENEAKGVLMLAVCVDGKQAQYLDSVRKCLALCKEHCYALSESVFLIDEIEAYPALLNVLALCNQHLVSVLVTELKDAPVALSPDNQEMIHWFQKRGYRMKMVKSQQKG